ncbi:MAG TPA: hypothetical protein ENH94_04455 [Phycisphaerales bacterium]|nr:hypothetical protein [Phycisphaerales bacterium]
MKKLYLILFIVAFSQAALAEKTEESVGFSKFRSKEIKALEKEFLDPPMSSRPRTWWHWLSNNVTKDGITKDLEAMKKIGIKGAQVTTMPQGAPYGPVKYLSDEWLEASAHAAEECDRLGMGLGFSNAIGCSGAGGPWIKPELSMQELVWSEITIDGPFKGELQLRQPKINENYYRDLKVFAFPSLPGDGVGLSSLNPKVTCNIAGLDTSAILDGDIDTGAVITGTGSPVDINFEFGKPLTAYSLQILVADSGKHNLRGVKVTLFTSTDGKNWSYKLSSTGHQSFVAGDKRVFSEGSESEITSRYFKVRISSGKGRKISLNEIFLGGARLPRYNFKAARSTTWVVTFDPVDTNIPKEQLVDSSKIMDITSQMDSTGKLSCKLPAGNWTIVRMGHTSTGRRMNPDTPEDKDNPGLQADKMRKEAILTHLEKGLVGRVARQMKTLKHKNPITINIDSWECGAQTWTRDFPAEFKQRRGYDCMKWLLTVTGRIIDSADVTDRFLWDFRRTIGDLYAENYFGTFRDYCHANNMVLEGEVPGTGIPAIADGLQCLGIMDVPQGEFWIRAKPGPNRHWGLSGGDNTKEAAVAAHVYGKEITSCEAFTSFGYADGWQMDPQQLKPIGDRQFCKGMNEMVFHCYAHQNDDRFPGMTLGQFGLNFTRKLTWWDQGSDWIEYITRCQHVLRQGLFVADVCYFYGENAPSSVYYYVPEVLYPRKMNKPVTPAGFDYDCCDWTTLNKMTVKDGRVVLPHGMSYAYLVIPANAQMTVHSLKKVRELVLAGATVVGPEPLRSPTLTGYPQTDKFIQSTAGKLWPKEKGPAGKPAGKGRVINCDSFEEIFKHDKLPADFEVLSNQQDTDILYIHRKLDGMDIYFVCNQKERMQDATLLFRASNKVPEIWHPETGTITKAPLYSFEGDRTAVAVRMKPFESFFVVLRESTEKNDPVVMLTKDGQPTGLRVLKTLTGSATGNAALSASVPEPSVSVDNGIRLTVWQAGTYTAHLSSGATQQATVNSIAAPATLEGPWKVSFQQGRLAPEGDTVFDKLISWPEHTDKGIKYFSGTASYKKNILIGKDRLKRGMKAHLDLGRVKNVAQVFVNGKDMGVLWKKPFDVDITSALHEGDNELEIRITNLWPNRLIGDQNLPPNERVTWEFYRFYDANSPLLESGLLGPVRLLSSVEVEASKPGGI